MSHRFIAAAVLLACAPLAAHAVVVPGQGTWESTLEARDLDGDLTTAEAYYSMEQNITWLADATAVAMHNYETVFSSVAALDPYGSGITGWRLPIAIDVDYDGCSYENFYQGVDCGYNFSSHSELSYLWYVTLGNLAVVDTSGNAQPGGGLTNWGPFANLAPCCSGRQYWTSTPNPGTPWYLPSRFAFAITTGHQGYTYDYDTAAAWAVHNGDVGTPLDAPACDDGLDGDGDGFADYPDDPGCTSAEDDDEHEATLACDNGLDDDSDGNADHPNDVGCQSLTSALENPQCQDGVDNDGVLGTDFDGGESVLGVGNGDPNGPDPQCTSAWKNREARPPSGACGVGPELVPALALLALARRRRRAR